MWECLKDSYASGHPVSNMNEPTPSQAFEVIRHDASRTYPASILDFTARRRILVRDNKPLDVIQYRLGLCPTCPHSLVNHAPHYIEHNIGTQIAQNRAWFHFLFYLTPTPTTLIMVAATKPTEGVTDMIPNGLKAVSRMMDRLEDRFILVMVLTFCTLFHPKHKQHYHLSHLR